jgi:glutaredoxin
MIIIYYLLGCPYSESAKSLVEEYGLNHKIIKVTHDTKTHYKKKNKMSTFPQIFLTRSLHRKSVKFKIGGYTDLEKYLITVANIKLNRLNLDVINYFIRVMHKNT